jgi:hypothetical protein
MLHFIIVVILFLVAPILLIWRVYQVPVVENVLMQLTWRGAVAGVSGGSIGATLSSFVFGAGAYAIFAYLYLLLITAILGMMFTLIIAGIQKLGLSLNLFGRAAIGAVIGIVMAWGWATAVLTDDGGRMNWASKGILGMVVCSGITSGLLSGPLNKKA